MTCIVAIETRNAVWMGSDSAGSDGFWTATMESPKLFRNGPAMIGVCGSFRMAQILRYGLDVPPITDDLDRYMATAFPKAVRRAFREGGWDYSKNGVAEGGNFIVAINSRAYEVQDDYSFMRSASREYAVGSGCYHAAGSLSSTRDYAKPKARILAALEAAAEHVVTVAPPFVIRRA